jgi:hypothetical protein
MNSNEGAAMSRLDQEAQSTYEAARGLATNLGKLAAAALDEAARALAALADRLRHAR